VTKTVPWGQYSGITKIIPPPEWTSELPPITPANLASIQIKNPIAQSMLGRAGLFKQSNVEKSKAHPISVEEWFNKTREEKFAGPGPKDSDRSLKRDEGDVRARKEVAEKRREETKRKRTKAVVKAVALDVKVDVENEMDDSKEEGPSDSQPTRPEDIASGSRHSSPDPLAIKSEVSDVQMEVTEPDHVSPSDEIQQDMKWYEEFHGKTAWLPKDTTQEDYTPENCLTLERKFWKTLGTGQPSWYGADLQGGLCLLCVRGTNC
jgi:hypothetical protein